MNAISLLKQLVLALIILAIGWGLSQKYFFTDWETRLNQQQAEVFRLKGENDATDQYRIERDKLQRDVEAARDRYKQLEAFLPSADNFGTLFEDVKVQARRANLLLERKDDTHPPYKPGLNESPMTLQLRGRFLDQLSFLNWLAGYSRVVVFNHQTITNNGGDTTMTLEGFVPIDLPTPEAANAANNIVSKP